jgi:hypothetical protein
MNTFRVEDGCNLARAHPRATHYINGMRNVLVISVLLCACASASPTEEKTPPQSDTYLPGTSYFGRGQYIEYMAGSLPIILTAPHGGHLLPTEIPDRTDAACGGTATTVTDTNTRELVLAMRDSLYVRFGRYPHVIINHLSRRKLDPNRSLPEAACGDAEAVMAWGEFQAFVDSAKRAVTRRSGKGWYMDMHGHGHAIARLELGYLLSGSALDRTDAQLDSNPAYEDTSSIRAISKGSPLTFAQLLRGATSLGALYEQQGFPAVPGPAATGPQGAAYFDGGYNTARHGCGIEAGASAVCGVQIESNFTGVRDTPLSRARFAGATATVLSTYLKQHWALDLAVN